MTSVSHAPSPVFSTTVTMRIVAHNTKPTAKSAISRRRPGSLRLVRNARRSMPNIDSEKVMKTLMLYSTTS